MINNKNKSKGLYVEKVNCLKYTYTDYFQLKQKEACFNSYSVW